MRLVDCHLPQTRLATLRLMAVSPPNLEKLLANYLYTIIWLAIFTFFYYYLRHRLGILFLLKIMYVM